MKSIRCKFCGQFMEAEEKSKNYHICKNESLATKYQSKEFKKVYKKKWKDINDKSTKFFKKLKLI